MASLTRLVINDFRNIPEAELHFAPGFNLFYGDNGCGKTSILEALHLLGVGRSFRGHQQKPLIRDGKTEAVVFGETTSGLTLGVRSPARGAQTIQVAGKKADSLSLLPLTLPLQLINSDTFKVLEGSPQERRRFLDWGVFHVEQQFLPAWRRARRALQNRNSLLKSSASAQEIAPWSQELVRSADLIDAQRLSYIGKLKAELESGLGSLIDLGGQELGLSYYRGWNSDVTLAEQLEQDLKREYRYGYTLAGPHRAELHFRLGQHQAAEVLSRGQLKLLICLMKISQARLLYRETGQRCAFLVDDLPAELDAANKRRVCSLLGELESQIFITSIERALLEPELESLLVDGLGPALFHVKHGTIARITQAPP